MDTTVAWLHPEYIFMKFFKTTNIEIVQHRQILFGCEVIAKKSTTHTHTYLC